MVTETSAGPPSAGASSFSIAAIILRGAGLIAGSPTARPRPGRVTMPTPSPAPEHDAGVRRRGPHPGFDQRAVGHVGVVAGILAHGSAPVAPVALGENQREGGRLATRQRDRDWIGEAPGDQRGVGGPRRSRGAGAGGPAPPKLAGSP